MNKLKHTYRYDLLGQLTAVLDTSGKAVEQYTYDPAGNILKKDINGKITTYSYDKANQLASSVETGQIIHHEEHEGNEAAGGLSSVAAGSASGGASSVATAVRRTDYQYDAAGRLIRETSGEAGNDALRRTEYNYGWLDKVMNITEGDKIINSFSYHVDGQLAERRYKDFEVSGATATENVERFVWDGLALISRSGTEYVNEPAITGGNPIVANGKALFNDLLGNTLGVAGKDEFSPINRTAFGKVVDNPAGAEYNLFTGKPHIEGLGYAFLFRSYRPELGKWQTQDPIGVAFLEPGFSEKDIPSEYQLGYPDGWNNLAYVNNKAISYIDWQGTVPILISSGNTIYGEQTWDEPLTGYDTYAAAVAATVALLNALHDSVYGGVQAGLPYPQFAVADSWDDDRIVRPMVGGSGQWYIARVSTTLTYSVYE